MENEANGERLAWDKPQLVELNLGMGNVENSYLVGGDGENAGGNSDS